MPLIAIWVIAIAVGVLVLTVIVRWRVRQDHGDLGVMNDQWLAEQRLSHIPDHNR